MSLLAHWLLNYKRGSVVKLLLELLFIYFAVPKYHESNGQ